jgi:hypothetical protein
VSSQIAKLQGQLKELTQKLKDTANSDMEPKLKVQTAKMLQAQIQAIQAQIQALQQQQAQQKSAGKASSPQVAEGTEERPNYSPLGVQVDTYA